VKCVLNGNREGKFRAVYLVTDLTTSTGFFKFVYVLTFRGKHPSGRSQFYLPRRAEELSAATMSTRINKQNIALIMAWDFSL
jgi:hypothetical protein